MFRIRPQFHSFGLDVSDFVLRMMELRRVGKRVRLVTYGEIPLDSGIIVEGEIKRHAAAVRALEQLVAKHRRSLTTKHVVASLPERKTFTKVLDILNVPDREVAGAVKWEIEQHIPIDIEDAYLDWLALPGPIKPPDGKRPVLVTVAPKATVDSYTKFLDDAGLVPFALETESSAVVRSTVSRTASPTREATIRVDIGASRTGLIIYDNGTVQFTSTVAISGRQMTEVIAKRLKLDWGKAEEAKLLYGLEERKGRGTIRDLLEPIVDDLGRKIGEAVSYYQDHFVKAQPITRVVLCGGVSHTKRLVDALAAATNRPVHLANPWTNVELSTPLPKDFPSLSYTTAIGLALRNT